MATSTGIDVTQWSWSQWELHQHLIGSMWNIPISRRHCRLLVHSGMLHTLLTVMRQICDRANSTKSVKSEYGSQKGDAWWVPDTWGLLFRGCDLQTQIRLYYDDNLLAAVEHDINDCDAAGGEGVLPLQPRATSLSAAEIMLSPRYRHLHRSHGTKTHTTVTVINTRNNNGKRRMDAVIDAVLEDAVTLLEHIQSTDPMESLSERDIINLIIPHFFTPHLSSIRFASYVLERCFYGSTMLRHC